MNSTRRWLAVLLTPVLCLGVVAESRAELIDRGTYDGVRLIYDSVQRITWLGDANWAKTSGADPDGEMTWAEARQWASRLTIAGLSDWRLPITSDETCTGTGCTNSEMGHLFDVQGVSAAAPGPFSNLQERQYWSSRSDTSDPDLGWYVHFVTGDQGATAKSDHHIAWAVRDGDVGAEVSIDPTPEGVLARAHLGSADLAGCGAPESQTGDPAGLPAGYSSIGELAGRGELFAAGGQTAVRIHDGNHYHGYDGPLVWSPEEDATRTQGLLYGVEDGVIASAGYLIPQEDLAAGRSFHGMTLREVDLPAARSMTVDFIPGDTAESGQYLFLWRFQPPSNRTAPTLEVGDLPLLASLGNGYTVVACDHVPDTRFCPGMGRHYTDLSVPTGGPAFARQPEDTGTAGVIFGEAAGKLIFIEYVFGQADLIEGMSWPPIPLDDLPIPPIDNIHVLHFGTDESRDGRYTVHMYFLPEEAYLGWETEPESL